MTSRRSNRPQSPSENRNGSASPGGASFSSAGEALPTRRPPPTRTSKRARTQMEGDTSAAQDRTSASQTSDSENRLERATAVGAGDFSSTPADSGLRRNEVSPEVRRQMIAEAAFLRASARGFLPGYDQDDWFAAEREVDEFLRASTRTPPQ